VWFPSEDVGWLKGRVIGAPFGDPGKQVVNIEIAARKFSADVAGQQYANIPVSSLLPVSELDDPDIIADVLDLHNVHDAAVFDTLRLRYFHDRIYTQAGPGSLISINPYKPVPSLYTQIAIDQFSAVAASRPAGTVPPPPHIFGLAQTAYDLLLAEDGGACQSILCSGESGAGKTEVPIA
jgi:myosin heavy subunit